MINVTSKKQESHIIKALKQVEKHIQNKFESKLRLVHETQWFLSAIVTELRQTYPEAEFQYHFPYG